MTHGTDRLGVLRDQLDLTWMLAGIVLEGLTDDECAWLPSPQSWAVRDGVADWVDDPPDDMAQPSLAWTMWQTQWWWSTLVDQAEGRGTPRREDVRWPGAVEGLAELGRLYARWDAFLAGCGDVDLDAGGPVTFPFDDGRPLIAIVGWANVELTKNVAEMGVLRRLASS